MRFAFILAGLAAASSAPAIAADPDACRAVERLVAAARESPSFESLRTLPGDTQIIAGFQARDCRITPGRAIMCSLRASSTGTGVRPSLAECPGVVEVPVAPSPLSPVPPVHYRLGGLDFGFALGCQRCANTPVPRFWAEVTDPPPD